MSPKTTLIIFGITGDLAHRKLLPALYQLHAAHLLPENFEIIGISRREVSVDEVMGPLRCQEGYHAETLQELADKIHMLQVNLVDPAEYQKIVHKLKENGSECNLFYLSMPPQMFGPVIENLAAVRLNTPQNPENRLIIEKPFGYDLASAVELIQNMGQYYAEEQIYRIDHYLAKETAQNILAFRFHNPIFEETWNRRFVKHIRITAAETIGIEGRAVFYEQVGALRDLIQSHLLQLLALITMEKPSQLHAKEIHAEKLRLLQAITPIAPDEVSQRSVRGQYDTYREEVQNPHSCLETFAALQISIDNERWQGVPVLLETGKALAEKTTCATITYCGNHDEEENILTIQLQPDEGITLCLWVKRPGLDNKMERVEMDFRYNRSFTIEAPEAYQRVFMDAIRGDQTLFASSEEIVRSWEIIEAVLRAWSHGNEGLKIYAKGTHIKELSAPLT